MMPKAPKRVFGLAFSVPQAASPVVASVSPALFAAVLAVISVALEPLAALRLPLVALEPLAALRLPLEPLAALRLPLVALEPLAALRLPLGVDSRALPGVVSLVLCAASLLETESGQQKSCALVTSRSTQG